MADNKNQAQLLEDYGQNVLSGAGGGGGVDYFFAFFELNEDESSYTPAFTYQDVQDAYDAGKIIIADIDGSYQGYTYPIFNDDVFDGFNGCFVGQNSDNYIIVVDCSLWGCSTPDEPENQGYAVNVVKHNIS